MTDIVNRATRSRMMANIKGRNTKPELVVRSALHGMGFRFSLHRKDLPGKPDIVLPKWNTVIFVHGCFWHCHQGCKYFQLPKSNIEFWRDKLEKNAQRDRQNIEMLLADGWSVGVIWECVIRDQTPLAILKQLSRIHAWTTRERNKQRHLVLGLSN